MYYEERVDCKTGILEGQNIPNGPWTPVTGPKADICKHFVTLSAIDKEYVYTAIKELIRYS